jgi:DNA-binding transcriptional LysR family regulator
MQEGGLFVWRFEKNRRKLNVRVEGQLVFNDATALLDAALKGFGVAYLPEQYALPYCRAVSLSGSWQIGARPFQAIISTIPAVASRRRLSQCWSTQFDIALTRLADAGL